MKSTRLPLPLPLKEWMPSDLSNLALLVIQIDGIHMDEKSDLGRGDWRRRDEARSHAFPAEIGSR
jgi:hypothetical protein